MKLLLDTHALIWWLANDSELGRRPLALINDRNNTVLVSIVSLWEIVVKMRVGKLNADLSAMTRAIADAGFTPLPITHLHLLELASLPRFHQDPFDHLLIAQAIAEDATFISADRHTPSYAVRYMTCDD